MSLIGFLYPGQGSQYVGMGKDFYENYDKAKELFQKADKILGYKLTEVMFHGPQEKLKDTAITQPAIFVHSCIITELLKEKGISPIVVAGHSLGEYSALYGAGYVDFETGLNLVLKRAQAMQKINMTSQNFSPLIAVIGGKIEKIEELCKKYSDKRNYAAISIINSPSQVVVGGNPEILKKISDELLNSGVKKVVPLKVSGPFHTQWMKKAAEEFKNYLDSIQFSKPMVPLYSNVEAKANMDEEKMKELLVAQIWNPIKWTEVLKNMYTDGIDTYVEVGPGKVLKGLMRSNIKAATVIPVGTVEQFEKFIESYGENAYEVN